MRFVGRLFRLDMSYLLSGGAWTSLSFGIGILGSVITMVAFGNLLPRETYGTYNYLLSLGASLSFLTLSGTGMGVMRAVARGYENVVPEALRLQLKYNLIAIATVLAVAFYYGVKGNMTFAISLFMLALAYPLAEAFHIYVQILTGRKRFDILTKTTSIVTLIGAAITVLALYFTNNILVLIAIYSFMSLVPNVIFYKRVTRDLDKTRPDPEQIRELRRTSFHLTGAGLIGVIASYIDKIILFQVAGPVSLAVYGFAIAGPERLKSLMKNWNAVAAPKIARSTLSEIRRTLKWHITFGVLVGISLALVYLLFSPLLFRIFLPNYLDAIPYSQVMALTLVVAPISIYMGSIFSSQNMLRATYALSVGNHILRITLFVFFAWKWQIWGLVYASILSNLANGIYGLIIWKIESKRLILKNEEQP